MLHYFFELRITRGINRFNFFMALNFRVCDHQKALRATSSIRVIIIIDNTLCDHERGQYRTHRETGDPGRRSVILKHFCSTASFWKLEIFITSLSGNKF